MFKRMKEFPRSRRRNGRARRPLQRERAAVRALRRRRRDPLDTQPPGRTAFGRLLRLRPSRGDHDIDVNTGPFVGSRSKTSASRLEDTITKNNLEAVKEVARQLRLRDIGGIIVIDFIDMAKEKNRQAGEERSGRARGDRTKTHVVEISPLGLVEMTRQNVTEGPREILTRKCPTCGGDGVVISEQTAAIDLERRLRALAHGSRVQAFRIEVNAVVAAKLIGPGAAAPAGDRGNRKEALLPRAEGGRASRPLPRAPSRASSRRWRPRLRSRRARRSTCSPSRWGCTIRVRLLRVKLDGYDVVPRGRREARRQEGEGADRARAARDGLRVGRQRRRRTVPAPITAEGEAEKPTRRPAAKKPTVERGCRRAGCREGRGCREAGRRSGRRSRPRRRPRRPRQRRPAEDETGETPPKKKTRRGSRGGPPPQEDADDPRAGGRCERRRAGRAARGGGATRSGGAARADRRARGRRGAGERRRARAGSCAVADERRGAEEEDEAWLARRPEQAQEDDRGGSVRIRRQRLDSPTRAGAGPRSTVMAKRRLRIIILGGKQYVVKEGETLSSTASTARRAVFQRDVLLVGGDGDGELAPTRRECQGARARARAEGADRQVQAEVGLGAGTGFRSSLTRIEITGIGAKQQKSKAEKAEKPSPTPKAEAAPETPKTEAPAGLPEGYADLTVAQIHDEANMWDRRPSRPRTPMRKSMRSGGRARRARLRAESKGRRRWRIRKGSAPRRTAATRSPSDSASTVRRARGQGPDDPRPPARNAFPPGLRGASAATTRSSPRATAASTSARAARSAPSPSPTMTARDRCLVGPGRGAR